MTNETKQTAVEWLEKKVDDLFISYQKGFMSAGNFISLQHRLFKKAKELEIQNLKSIYGIQFLNIDSDGEVEFKPFDQWYNETFNK